MSMEKGERFSGTQRVARLVERIRRLEASICEEATHPFELAIVRYGAGSANHAPYFHRGRVYQEGASGPIDKVRLVIEWNAWLILLRLDLRVKVPTSTLSDFHDEIGHGCSTTRTPAEGGSH